MKWTISLLMASVCIGVWPFSEVWTQSQASELLRQLEKSPRDTHRVSLLIDYAWEIMEDQPEAAEARFWEAIQEGSSIGFALGEAAGWNGLGVLEESIRLDYEKAKKYHKKALQIRRTTGNNIAIASSLNNLALLQEDLGYRDSAIVAYREAILLLSAVQAEGQLAKARYNLAGLYEANGNYKEAKEQLIPAQLYFEQTGDEERLASSYNLLGHINFELELWKQALEAYDRANILYTRLSDTSGMAGARLNLGNALDDYGNKLHSRDSIQLSIAQYESALQLFQQTGDSLGIARVLNSWATTHKHLGQYEEGLERAAQAFAIVDKYGDKRGKMEVINTQGDLYYSVKKYAQALELTRQYEAIALEIQDDKFIQKALKDYAKLYEAMGEFELALKYQKAYNEMRYQRLDETRAREHNMLDGFYTDMTRKAALDQTRIEVQTARATRNALFGGAAALALLVALFYNRSRLRAKANRDLAAKNELIERERARADELLMNILPESTAEELKRNNSVRPVRYESATVLFTDFKGFTKIAELVTPEELVRELDECFRMFDEIVQRHGLEKIKTIGDAYMCAGGLPEPNTTHALDAVRAGIEMVRGLHRMMERKAAEGKPVFQMRVGIHTGPVVAGVVGSHKFAYDIWGDTVNTAARMEQGSEPGRVNISEVTYALVKDTFPCTYRGALEAKNKGAIEMYFVEFDL